MGSDTDNDSGKANRACDFDGGGAHTSIAAELARRPEGVS
jgi:hypothetical protein